MKRTSLLFVLLITIFMGVNAQVVFQEDFNTTADGAIPTGWTRFNVDGLTPYTSVAFVTDAWVAKLVTGTAITTKAAWSTSYYSPAGVANDWMFTPAIVIPSSNPVLQFTEYTPNAQYPDGYELRIMTAVPALANLMTSTVLSTVAAASTTPLQKTINLTAYAGQTVYIGWRNNSNDKVILGIDDVVVKALQNNDAAVSAINTPVNVAVGNNNITGTVKNVGANIITSYDVSYKVNSGVASAIYSVTAQNIAVGATATFTHNVPANLAAGYDTIEVTISNVNAATDPNLTDNVLKKVVRSIVDNDIALTAITTPAMLGAGNSNITGTVKNMSVTPITTFNVTYKIDGGAASAVYSVTGQNIAYLGTYNFTHNVPANLAIGSHTVEVTISNVNAATDPDLTNNVLSKQISIGSSSFPRKVLFEEFSTEQCPNCPTPGLYLHGLAVADTSVIMMVHHAGYYTDPYTIPANTTMCAMFNDGGSTYAPAGMADRNYWNADMDNDGTIDPGPVFWPGTPYGGNAITARKALPAFVSANINGLFNPTTKELTVTVSGNFTANFTSSLGVSLWLTQDNITSTAQAGYTGTWTHHDLVRAPISAVWGDAITTPTTDGSSYTKTYTYTVNSAWDVANLELVAFVNQIDAANVNNRAVLNANAKKLSLLPTSVSELQSGVSFSVYPNPAKDNLQVNFNLNEAKNVNVKIYNTLGELVFSNNEEQLSSGNHSFDINVSKLSKGIYYMNLQAGESGIAKKIVIE